MSVYDEIKLERQYQDSRWGTVTDDTKNTPWMWASYIGHYSTKWMRGTFLPLDKDVVSAFRECMVKVASICVAAVESVDRQRANNNACFYEK